MKKFLSIVLCFTILLAKAQSPEEVKAPWIDSDQNCFSIQIENSKDNVEGALKQRLTKEGLKVSSKKGFITCLSANWAKISSSTMDFYFKIKKVDNAHSILYLYSSKGYNNFISTAVNPDECGKVKDFLVEMITETRKFDLTNQLNDLIEQSKKADADLDDLIKKQRKMEDQIKDLNKRLEDNKGNQADKQKQIAEFKGKIAELQGRIDALH